jgi:hypothetical protein
MTAERPRFVDIDTKLSRRKVSKHADAIRLCFNFSFITHDRKYNFTGKYFDKKMRTALLQNVIKLSAEDLVNVLNWDKQSGLERLPSGQVHFSVNQLFISSGRFTNCMADYWIFRLNRLGRVIGKLDGSIFYILCIDATFDTYDHG